MVAFEGNCFVNAEFAGKFKVVVLLFYYFIFAKSTTVINVASFTFVQRHINIQGRRNVVFCVPDATIFFQCASNVRFKFVGNVQGFAVSNQAVFHFYGEASGFGDAIKNFVEVVIKSLATNCKAIFIIVMEHFIQGLDVQLFFAFQKSSATIVVGTGFCALVRQLYQVGRKLQNFCQMFALGKKLVFFALSFAVDNISKLTVNTTALFQGGFVHFSAPFFHSAGNLSSSQVLSFFSFYQNVIDFSPRILYRFAIEQAGEKSTFFYFLQSIWLQDYTSF